MLGLNNGNKFKSWVLLADWFDVSYSRNYLNFFIGSKLNIYSSDFKFVEVFLNGEYRGVYLLCEQQQINKNRINIEEYEPGVSDELDTGYLLENDYFYYETEDYYIENTINGQAINLTHWVVKSDTTTPAQMEYIQNYMQSIYDAIFENKTQAEIEALIDVDSAVEMTILQLINRNTDANSSFYVYKDKGGKLQFGAPWDADMAYGILNHGSDPEGISVNHLFEKLLQNDWYLNMVKARWKQLVEAGLITDVYAELDKISTTYEAAFMRNFSIYDLLGQKTFPYQVDEVESFKNQKDASLYLKNWLEKRFTWLNEYLA